MKTLLTLSALCVALSLTACGKHHGTHATEVVETAEANAKALAPKAEPIKFDDEGAPKAGETAAATDNTATATATDGKTDDKQANTATATAESKTDDKQTATADSKDGEQAEQKTEDKK